MSHPSSAAGVEFGEEAVVNASSFYVRFPKNETSSETERDDGLFVSKHCVCRVNTDCCLCVWAIRTLALSTCCLSCRSSLACCLSNKRAVRAESMRMRACCSSSRFFSSPTLCRQNKLLEL